MGWTQNGNIRGASGIPGASGASGPPGATGPAGPTGASGGTGGTGGTGGPGTTTWAGITDKPGAILNYKGTWNVSSNSPTLSDSTGSGGDVYRVSVGGSRNLGSGTISWEVGDYAIYSPVTSSWEKADTTDAVSSVAGRTGDVTLTVADIGASGTPSASTFLRGDGTWATGPTGATGATGASGGTGGTGGVGASGPGFYRVISTITAPTTIGASGNTDYVVICSGTAESIPSHVKLLLRGDGANNSTTFTDSSTASTKTVSIQAGSPVISTAQSKFGGSSIYFNGSSAIKATSSDFAFGTGDFTLECWVYPTSFDDYNAVIGTRQTSGADSAGYSFMYDSAGYLFIYSTGFVATSAPGVITTNTWQHIAACRSGSTVRLFKNGTQVGSATYTNNFTNTTIALGGYVGDMTQTVFGYIDDVRVSSSALYTSNFTAPTQSFYPGDVGTPTLPSATSNNGRYAFRNISGSSIVIGASGSQRINGATGGLSLSNGTAVELISDGSSGWYAI